MHTTTGRWAALLVAFGPALALGQFHVDNLVSDGFVAADHTDPNLVNAWGLSLSPTGPFWVANNGTATSTLYDGEGNPFPLAAPLVVNIPPKGDAAPTGTVFSPGTGFVVSANGKSGPARFLFDGEDGTISGWNPTVDPTNAVVAVDNSSRDASYKGLAIAKWGNRSFIYATNFNSGLVEAYDEHFHLAGRFTDRFLPPHYAPFGIQAIGHFLVVTYALRGPDGDDVAGPGHGFVDLFLPNGHLVWRLASHGALNSPWGIALAPKGFGRLGHTILIGNFGDGRINAYHPLGVFLGPLRDENHKPISIDDLWALSPGNDGTAGDSDDIYFTAGPGDEEHGLFGEISLEQDGAKGS